MRDAEPDHKWTPWASQNAPRPAASPAEPGTTGREALAGHLVHGFNGSQVLCQCRDGGWLTRQGYAAHLASLMGSRDAAPGPETRGHADLLHIGEPSSPAAEAAAAGAPIGHSGLVEEACEVMHDAYEAAAVGAGWETQRASRKPWADVPEANKATMRAAVLALLDWLRAPGEPGEGGALVECGLCGGPLVRNPHPDAGKPTGEWRGYVWACIPCIYKALTGWQARAAAARAEAAGLRAERNAQATALAKVLHLSYADEMPEPLSEAILAAINGVRAALAASPEVAPPPAPPRRGKP